MPSRGASLSAPTLQTALLVPPLGGAKWSRVLVLWWKEVLDGATPTRISCQWDNNRSDMGRTARSQGSEPRMAYFCINYAPDIPG